MKVDVGLSVCIIDEIVKKHIIAVVNAGSFHPVLYLELIMDKLS